MFKFMKIKTHPLCLILNKNSPGNNKLIQKNIISKFISFNKESGIRREKSRPKLQGDLLKEGSTKVQAFPNYMNRYKQLNNNFYEENESLTSKRQNKNPKPRVYDSSYSYKKNNTNEKREKLSSNQEAHQRRIQQLMNKENWSRVNNAHVYAIKQEKELKNFYYTNKDAIHNKNYNIIKVCDLLDVAIKIHLKEEKLKIKEIVEITYIDNLMNLIYSRKDEVKIHNLLKFMNLTINNDYCEKLVQFTASVLKAFNFDKYMNSDINLESKVSVDESSLFNHKRCSQLLNYMTRFYGYFGFCYDKVQINSYALFRNSLIVKLLLNSQKFKDFQHFQTDSLLCLFNSLTRESFKQIDVIKKISDELSHEKKILAIDLKGIISILSNCDKLNLTKFSLITTYLKVLNNLPNLEEDLKTLKESEFFDLLNFLRLEEYYNVLEKKVILKLLDRLTSLMREENRIITNKCYLFDSLYILYNEERFEQMEELMLSLRENINKVQLLNFVKFFPIYCRVLKKNSPHHNNNNSNLLVYMTEVFKKSIDRLSEESHQLSLSQFARTASCLAFEVLPLLNTINSKEYKEKVELFLISMLTEKFLVKIAHDSLITIDIIRYFQCLKRIFPELSEKVSTACIEEVSLIIENNRDDKIDDERQIIQDDLNEDERITFSFTNTLNLLIFITNLKIKVDPKYFDFLLKKLVTSPEVNKNNSNINFMQKVSYNKIFVAFSDDIYYILKNANLIEVENVENINNSINDNFSKIQDSMMTISQSDIKNNIFKHVTYQNLLIDFIKEYKKAIFIETDYVLDKLYYLDVYIPSLKVGFIIDQASEILNMKIRHMEDHEYNYLDLSLKEKLEREKGIAIHCVSDYFLEEYEYRRTNNEEINENHSGKLQLKQILKAF